jgi:L-threonylcarbamoyladenylate synthase
MFVCVPDPANIKLAAQFLYEDKLVAFPTETVYGLGANAESPDAIACLYKTKGRPGDHPVIVHVGSIGQLSNWASDIPQSAFKLGEHFWPGPLTLILPKASHVSSQITGGQNTIGLRIPKHPVALALLTEFGGGIAAPSANRFGRLSATEPEHVVAEFSDAVSMVLDGGPCELGIESTIVDLTGAVPRIMRPGIISPEQIIQVLDSDCKLASGQADPDANRVPGSLPSHYAPNTPLKLLTEKELNKRLVEDKNHSFAVLAFHYPNTDAATIPWITASKDPLSYAQKLYASLRELDKRQCDFILVEAAPDSKEWLAINDRLTRAAYKL